ncbi:MAG: hypothetical protein AB7T31_12395 [Gemmatimonadales bacterium]
MILRCNYEEVEALRGGARALLRLMPGSSSVTVLAPPESRARVEALLPRLRGDLSVATLGELHTIRVAVDAIVEHLREEMDAHVLAAHPADESAVNAYFAYAHALTVSNRVREVGEEMEAIIELVIGGSPSAEALRTFRFPD